MGKSGKEYSWKDKTRIFIVEGNSILREAITTFLNSKPGFEICGESCCYNDVTDKVSNLNPDVILIIVPISLFREGIILIGNIREKFKDLPIITLSMYTGNFVYEKYKNAGATICLDLLNAPGEIIKSLQLIFKRN